MKERNEYKRRRRWQVRGVLRKMTARREDDRCVCARACEIGCVHSWLPPPQAPLKRAIQQKVIHVQFPCEIKRDLSSCLMLTGGSEKDDNKLRFKYFPSAEQRALLSALNVHLYERALSGSG